jgi:hypothetical protein
LDAKEVDEFPRYVAGKALENLSMDEYAQARKNDLAEDWQFKSGLDFDDNRHPLDTQKARDAIAKKIAGDFVGEMWEAGAIDDKAYMAQMERVGGVAAGVGRYVRSGAGPYSLQ